MVLIASATRAIGTNCIGFYKPLFFANIYPEYVDQFSIGNAGVYVFFASTGALLGGYLSDKYEEKNYMTKAYICSGSTAIALPFISLCFLNQDNFWFSFGMMCCHYAISESWISPSITML